MPTEPLTFQTEQIPATISEDGVVPRKRVKDAKSAHELYRRCRKADEASAANRAKIRAMFNGEPPYNEADLVRTGQSERSNLDFGKAAQLLEMAMAGYVDTILSTGKLLRCETTYGDEALRKERSEIISEEISRMIRSWPGFVYTQMRKCLFFLSDGVSFIYRDHPEDWRCKVANLDEFFIPRKTEASEEAIPYAFCVREYDVAELYEFIEDDKVATDTGWNVEAVKDAIMDAKPVSSNVTVNGEDWSARVNELKCNDIYMGETSQKVKVVHMWVREFNGSLSHYMFREDGETQEGKEDAQFLYECRDKFENVHRAFTAFCYGIGESGLFHGIRGLGYKIYPYIQESNRLRCQMLDSAKMSSAIMVQPDSEEAAENLSFVYYGPLAVMSPGLKLVTERVIPNMSQSVMPVLADFEQQISNKTGQYTNNIFNDGKERTRFEVAATVEHLAKLSVTSLTMYYEPLDREYQETVRRIINKDYDIEGPGGQYIRELRLRLKQRGVPLDALYEVDVRTVRAVRAVGAGSQAARSLVFQNMKEMMGSLDEVGRNRVLREVVANDVGWDEVDEYVPPVSGPRATPDDKFAKMENAILEMSTLEKPVSYPVSNDDIPSVHLRIHAGKLDEYVQVLNSQPDSDELVMTVIPPMAAVHQHSVEHLNQMSGDELLQQEFAQYRKQLQNAEEIIYNGTKHIQKLQREAAQQQSQGGDGAAIAPEMAKMQMEQARWSQELERGVIEYGVKLKQAEETHRLKMAMEAQKAAQKRAIADAEAASKMQRERLLA